MTQYGFYFDSSRCTGCKTCELVCKDYHDLGPDILFRRIYDFEGGSWEKTPEGAWNKTAFNYHLAVSCNHCDSPACVENCPTGAMRKDAETGLVNADPEVCIGCGTCATVCPTCALESLNPSDAELKAACLRAVRGDEVVIACSQMEAALGDLLVPGVAASVICAGRVDESLLAGLAAEGVGCVTVLCGDCERCAQRHGRDTAELVAETARQVLATWGDDLEVVVTDVPPASILAEGADEAAAETVRVAYFAQVRSCPPLREAEEFLTGSSVEADALRRPAHSLHVMKDGTLPHFIPDRRERLLDALAQLGEPAGGKLATRLWGAVVIDGTKCVSCRMCATFCPTGAIAKFDDADGTLGVAHTPGDCVKCGSCGDVCPAGAITLLDAVPVSWLTDGSRHRYVMTPRPVSLTDNPHQILDTFRLDFNGDIFER